jgi:hypothetical protein
VTNEQYLYVSYFTAACGGVALAALTALWLRREHRRAAAAAERVGEVLRRAFPAWLILAGLLGFISVSYFDCAHKDYSSIVSQRDYLVEKTHEQASHMLYYLAAAVLAYCLVLAAVAGIVHKRK